MSFRHGCHSAVCTVRGWLSARSPRWVLSKSITITSLFLLSAIPIACRRGGGSGTPTAAAPPAPAVSVSQPIVQEITDWDMYTGRLAAPEAVDVRARVSGFIESAPFAEGTIVKQNDLLFTIDARPFQADLDRALAQLASAQAQVRFSEAELARQTQMRQTGAGSELEFLQARQNHESNQAAVAAGQAAVESARLNVEWCRVTAPIAGRVGRRLVTTGNLVNGGAGQTTLLTTITSMNPIYCYFDVDERSVRRYQQMVRQGVRTSARTGGLTAQLALTDEKEFGHSGRIDFVDNSVDPTTGTITVRGVFPNEDDQLLPGFFARVRLPGRGPYRATLVPDAAIGTTLAQQYVLVVGPDNVVQQRPVTTGSLIEGMSVVEGLDPDARVIVQGLVQARPGSKVQPQMVAPTAVARGGSTTQPAAASPAPAGDAVLASQRGSGGAGNSQGKDRGFGQGEGGGAGQAPSRSANGPAAVPGATGDTGPGTTGGPGAGQSAAGTGGGGAGVGGTGGAGGAGR